MPPTRPAGSGSTGDDPTPEPLVEYSDFAAERYERLEKDDGRAHILSAVDYICDFMEGVPGARTLRAASLRVAGLACTSHVSYVRRPGAGPNEPLDAAHVLWMPKTPGSAIKWVIALGDDGDIYEGLAVADTLLPPDG